MGFNPEILGGLNFVTAKETLLAEKALREYWQRTIYPKLEGIITSGNDDSLPKWIEMARIKGIEGIVLHPIFPVERGVLLEANGGLRYMNQSNGGINLSHPLRGTDYIMAHTQCLNLYNNRIAKGHPSRSKRFPF